MKGLIERIITIINSYKGGNSTSPILKKSILEEIEIISKLEYFPSSLIELYKEYNGIIQPFDYELLTDFYISPIEGYWLSLENSLMEYEKIIELENIRIDDFGISPLLGITQKQFFPFFYDGLSQYLLLIKNQFYNDTVLYYDFASPDTPVIYYNCVLDFFNTLEKCFLDGVYTYKDSNWDIDSIKLFQLIRQNNPDVNFWKVA